MVRYTLVPPARGWGFLHHVYETVPASPEVVEDCCGHIYEQTTVASREHAREWLVFLQALGCVESGAKGYFRTENPERPEYLAEPFKNKLFGVTEILEQVSTASEPLTTATVCERLDDPVKERLQSRAGTADLARDSVERRLKWADSFGLVFRRDDRYELQPPP